MQQPSDIHKVAFLGDYLPRKCGIATFTTDLRCAVAKEFPQLQCLVVPVNDIAEGYDYPAEVRFEIAEQDLPSYLRAADFLNITDVDVVCVEHEFGIFGGPAGSHVLALLRELQMPIVTTLHTILREPSPEQRRVMLELIRRSTRLVVMSERGREFLRDVYQAPENKIDLIPHGIPDMPFADPNYFKDEFGVAGKQVLLTFGLLSPNKGIEYVIEALPAIVERHPEVVYTIAGRTHPDIAHREGERYRLMLERRVLELGLEEHVEFDDRFLSLEELSDLLAATDVFVTPYRSREQISSGALTFAVAAGCGVVSTPYWYAQDMLATGAGSLVDFDDPRALAAAVCDYIEQPELLAAARTEARRIGSSLAWPSVAGATASVLAEAFVLAPRRRPHGVADLHLTSLRSDHLLTLVDDVGIVQHAHGIIPNRDSGYCVDDVARLAVVSLALGRRGDEQMWTAILYRSLAFLHAATGETGMRNFMSYDRRWLDEPHVGDHVGRSVWALGEILATAWIPALVVPARDLLARQVDALAGDVSPRTAAYAVLGLSRLDADRLDPRARQLLERLVEQLADAYERTATPDWSWFEDELAYDNARLSQALISGAEALGRDDLLERGLESLRWLGDESGLEDSYLCIAGHRGRRRDEHVHGTGDEQPLDAAAIVEAELAAYAVTRDPEHGRRAIRAFEWFLGRNRLQKPVYDFATGGCADGLGSEALNENEGAESTLALHRCALMLDAAGIRAGVGTQTFAPVMA